MDKSNRQVIQLLLDALKQWHTNPAGAADLLDEVSMRVAIMAGLLRERALANKNQFQSEGTICDRVKIQIVGPNGDVKQEIDTQS